MNTTRKPVRWRMVLLLGCSFGLLYVSVMLWLTPAEDNGPMNFSASESFNHAAPLKLSDDAVRDELTRVIASQLSAFRKDDYQSAYQYASASLKDQMPLPAFEKMVRAGYGMMAKSRSESFGLVVDNGSEAVVEVDLGVQSGKRVHYQYLLRREKGTWRIGGVKQVVSKTTIV